MGAGRGGVGSREGWCWECSIGDDGSGGGGGGGVVGSQLCTPCFGRVERG